MPPKKVNAGNPLWIGWLKEWKDEVLAKGGHSEHLPKAIDKAIKALEANPVPFEHPSEAQVLKNIGPAMIKELMKRQKTFCEEEGIPFPEPKRNEFQAAAAKATKKRKKGDQAEDEWDFAGPSASQNSAAGGGGSPPASINLASPAKPVKKAKAYAPRVSSGAWAILVGLVSFGSGAWKNQNDIIDIADPFFKGVGDSIRDKGNGAGPSQQFYNGWSNMKKLITEALVIKKGRDPVLYQLTQDGFKLARRAARLAKTKVEIDERARKVLPDFDEESTADEAGPAAQPSSDNEPPKKRRPTAGKAAPVADKGRGKANADSSDNSDAEPANGKHVFAPGEASTSFARAPAEPNSPEAPFLYCYLGPGEVRVQRRDEAEIRQNEVDLSAMYLIEFRVVQQRHILVKKNVKGAHVTVLRTAAGLGPEGRTVCAYLPAMHASARCPGFDSLDVAPAVARNGTSRGKESVSPSNKCTDSASSSSTSGKSAPAVAPKARTTSAAQSKVDNVTRAAAPADFIELTDSDSEPEKKKRASAGPRPAASKTATAGSVSRNGSQRAEPARERSASRPPVVQHNNLLGASVLAANTALPNIETLQTISMPPESYDILLMVDVREKPGLNNKRLERMLLEKEVQWASISLSMGDAIWVAKDKFTGMEVVLDCVLERKRRDDLEQSVKDGRYNEQKSRMQASGISRIIYLIEEHADKHTDETFGQTISTIKSSLQVIDNIQVHIAMNVAEVCSYLALLTQTFKELHSHTTFTVLPDSAISRDTYLPFITQLRRTRPATSYCISLDAFQNMNTKIHSIGTNWNKMVASINGMSLERAIRLVERFPTPASLFGEMEGQMQVVEALRALANAEQQVAANKRKKKSADDDGDCWIMRQTAQGDSEGLAVRPIGQALSTHCWKLFTAETYT